MLTMRHTVTMRPEELDEELVKTILIFLQRI